MSDNPVSGIRLLESGFELGMGKVISGEHLKGKDKAVLEEALNKYCGKNKDALATKGMDMKVKQWYLYYIMVSLI